jgi:hypothetical protein
MVSTKKGPRNHPIRTGGPPVTNRKKNKTGRAQYLQQNAYRGQQGSHKEPGGVIPSGLERNGSSFRGSCAGRCIGDRGCRDCRPRRQGGRTDTRGRRRSGRRGVQGAAVGSIILALLLGVPIIGIVLDTLGIIGVADVEWDGVLVECDIGGGAIEADAVEDQGILRRGQPLVIPNPN